MSDIPKRLEDEIAWLQKERAALLAEVRAARAQWHAGAACDDLETDDDGFAESYAAMEAAIEAYDVIREANERKGIG